MTTTPERKEFILNCEKLRSDIWASRQLSPLGIGTPAKSKTVLVGAGMSMNADGPKPPTWSKLCEDMAMEFTPGDPEKRARLLEEAKSPAAFPAIAQQLVGGDRGRLLDFLEKQILPQGIKPGKLHNMLLRIPWTDVLTTNFDKLLEDCAKSQRVHVYQTVDREYDLPRRARPRIIKLHGTLKGTQDVIFTAEDFRTYEDKYPVFVNTVRQSIIESVFVLIGFSGNDPNFTDLNGWLRDHLGEYSNNTFLVDLFDDNAPYPEALLGEKIQRIDLGQITPEELAHLGNDKEDTYQNRLEWLFSYLLKGEALPKTAWPEPLYGSGLTQDNGNSLEDGALNEALRFELDHSKILPQLRRPSFFSNSLEKLKIDKGTFCGLVEDLQHIRATYGHWNVAPADVRDEVARLMHWWISRFSKEHTSQKFTKTPNLPEFMAAVMEAMSAESFRDSFKSHVEVTGLETENGWTAAELASFQDWINGTLGLCVIEFIRDLLWLFDAALIDWPISLETFVTSALKKTQPDSEGHVDLEVPSEIRAELSLALLRRLRNVGGSATEFDAAQNCAELQSVTYSSNPDVAFERDIIKTHWYLDHGARRIASEFAEEIHNNLAKLNSYQVLRLGTLWDELADTTELLTRSRDLWAAAYDTAREGAGPETKDFRDASTEA